MRSIVALAKPLNLTITGEGVETTEQLEEQKALGCTTGQGYYFDKPLHAANVSALLGRTKDERASGEVPASHLTVHVLSRPLLGTRPA